MKRVRAWLGQTDMRRRLLRSAFVCLLLLALVVGLRGATSGSGEEGDVRGGAVPEGSFEDELLIVPRRGWSTDFSRHEVPLIEFQPGGPGRDGIRAIDRPRLTTVRAAGKWLEDDEPVIEVVAGGAARAYPAWRSWSPTARCATARWRSSAGSVRAR